MKCTNKRKAIVIFYLVLCIMVMTGCGKSQVAMKYDKSYPVTSYRLFHTKQAEVADTFASSLCLPLTDYTENTDVDMTNAIAAGLFDLTNHNTLYSKNLNTTLDPASITKIMTALVAIKYYPLDTVLTVSSSINTLEAQASKCGLKVGDTLTLDQALHALLISSSNDAAIVIAEGLAGSIEDFAALMNQEAKAIGATNSNFVNPHGLTASNHYVTAYDLYLIFQEAIQYDTFSEIISMSTYTTIYHDKNGNEMNMNVSTTNQYLNGTYGEPEKITVIGGKTGTTNAAGQCLIILAKDIYGNSYIGVILGSSERKILYEEMSDMLNEIYN